MHTKPWSLVGSLGTSSAFIAACLVDFSTFDHFKPSSKGTTIALGDKYTENRTLASVLRRNMPNSDAAYFLKVAASAGSADLDGRVVRASSCRVDTGVPVCGIPAQSNGAYRTGTDGYLYASACVSHQASQVSLLVASSIPFRRLPMSKFGKLSNTRNRYRQSFYWAGGSASKRNRNHVANRSNDKAAASVRSMEATCEQTCL
jgi:hypothetical protein